MEGSNLWQKERDFETRIYQRRLNQTRVSNTDLDTIENEVCKEPGKNQSKNYSCCIKFDFLKKIRQT